MRSYIKSLALFLSVNLITSLQGCSPNSESETYYPLKEGRVWEYQLSSRALFFGMKPKAIITNISKRELNGKTVTPQRIDIEGQTYFTFLEKIAAVYMNLLNKPQMI